jgi:chaperone BCS1
MLSIRYYFLTFESKLCCSRHFHTNSVVARNNSIFKQLVLQAKKEYEAEAVHRIQIYFADAHGSWRWTDSRHKRPMSSIVLNPGVKEMLLDDARDFLRSEKWYADRGIPFRRGYLLHGVPGSGKSSLIHALAGQLQLDIYVVSLSAGWISDNTLTTLMGRVPARCVLLLEDLDAAFVRSTTRDEDEGMGENDENKGSKGGAGTTDSFPSFTSGLSNSSGSSGGFSSAYGRSSGRSKRSRYGRSEGLSDVNTLSLSGLLNALDGVAASEGRLLFATTNHLERLDPALCRPGRMDVWVEFKNASRWQAEALFRNFFPSEEEEEPPSEEEIEGLDIDKNLHVHTRVGREDVRTFVEPGARDHSVSSEQHLVAPSSIWSLSTSIASSATSLISGQSSPILSSPTLSLPRTFSSTPASSPSPLPSCSSSQFGATNTAYLPPPPEPKVKVVPLDKKTLALLAKKFADGVPEEEFSVASLQGCESRLLLYFVACLIA